MNDLAELEGRITMALDRIALGLEAMPAAAGPDVSQVMQRAEEDALVAAERIQALSSELEQARAVNAQLSATMPAGANDEEVASLRAELEAQARLMQDVRKRNANLRNVVDKLRKAQEAKLTDPALIDQAMAAELEALKSARKADMQEMQEILAGLEPLVGEVSHG